MTPKNYKGHDFIIYFWEKTNSFSVEIFSENEQITPIANIVYGTLESAREAENVAYAFIDGMKCQERI